MKAIVRIDAGICGFQTSASIASDDEQMVAFDVQSACEKIRSLGELLKTHGPIDAYHEISPETEGIITKSVRSMLIGCCAGCAVPSGLFKGMQVAAGLALAKDIHIALTRE
jgi:hypothetical protein